MTPVLRLMALSLAMTAFPAMAQRPTPGPASAPLARATFIATMDAEYKKLDTNSDGMVTRQEIDAKQQRIAAAAVTQRARAIFSQLDTDRNGQVSAEEFIRANLAQIKKVDGTGVMNRLDANRDQKVSGVEYRILTLTNFDRLDADRDGILTVAEQRAGGLVK